MQSINQLLKRYELQSLLVQPGTKDTMRDSEGFRANPDIPGDKSASIKQGSLKSVYDLTPRDNYMRNSRIRKNTLSKKVEEVNGNYQRLQQGRSQIDTEFSKFGLEGSIDPNARMSRNDTKSLNPFVKPYDYINGSEGYYFRLPKDAFYSENSVDLLNKARESYASMMVSYTATPTSLPPSPPSNPTQDTKNITSIPTKSPNQDNQDFKNKQYDYYYNMLDLPA